MTTACNKKHKCSDSKATWCIGHVATLYDFEYQNDTCKFFGRKGMCTNRDAWPENKKKKVDHERVENG